jgi:ankyrin repeat protein
MMPSGRRSKAVCLGALVALVTASTAAMLAREATLVEALKSGDVAAARALLARRVDVNAAEADGTTPLHWAVTHDDEALVDQLLRAGARVQAANRYGVTPLRLAAVNGNAAIVERLLEAGADPNTAMPDGETVLMTAARTGAAGALRALLAAGADVQGREPSKGQTALMWAAAENNAAAVRLLIAHGADPRERSKGGAFTAYLFAVRAGHIDAAGALLDGGVPVDETLPDGTSALVLATINAHYELAGYLLDRGADPNADAQGWTALHQIAWSRRHNAGFNLPGPVATGGLDSLDLARRLVAKGADVNARQKKEPRDGNRNLQNRIGATPFLLAAKSADVPLMRALLELGADPTIKTNNGTTPLMVAAGVGIWAPGENPGTHDESLAAVRLALEVGAGDVNDIDDNGDTAMHGAVYRGGNVLVIQLLAERGARLDVVNKKGWMPVTAADGVEYTPAVLKRYPDAAALLRRLMAERGLPVPPSTQPGSDTAIGAPPAAVSRLTASSPPAPAAPGRAALPGSATRSVWTGVYTGEQAVRGAAGYKQACAHCHADDLLGAQAAPALVGQPFSVRWKDMTVEEILTTIRRTMPQEAPDTLGTAAYVDILSHMFRVQGIPAGTTELPADPEPLRQIVVTERPN